MYVVDGLDGITPQQARHQRSTVLAELEAEVDRNGDAADGETSPGPSRERRLEASVKAVKGLCNALDRRVSDGVMDRFHLSCDAFGVAVAVGAAQEAWVQ